MLKLTDVEVMYGRAILALRGVYGTGDPGMRGGEAEGAEGTNCRAVGGNRGGQNQAAQAGLRPNRSENGEVTQGQVELEGQRIDRRDAADIVRRGIMHVM